jgi:translocation and assembly module TamA
VLPPRRKTARPVSINFPRHLGIAALLLSACALAPAYADTVSVEIDGLEKEELDNARAFAVIHAAADAKDDLTPAQIRRLHQDAPEQIKAALKPFGYYRPTVKAKLEATDDGKWRATYQVKPGPPVLVHAPTVTLDGDGRDDRRLKDLVKRFPLKDGQRLLQELYRKFKDDLLTEANALGYLDARYSQQTIEIHSRDNTADIRLTLDTGARYLFGDVHFDDVNLKRRLLKRRLPFKPGEPYSNEKLLALSAALQDSGYFKNIEVVPQKADAVDLRIPIHVRLVERKRNKYTAGVGYGTDSGPRIKLGWENRRINRSGHTMKADLQASSILQSLSTTYRVPIRDPRTDRWEFTAAVSQESSDSAKSLLRQIGAARVVGRGGWRETLGLSYQLEDYELADETESSVLLIPSGNWTRTRSDDALRPSKGLRLSFTVRGAAAALLSDTNLFQAETGAKWIHSFGSKTRLLTRGRLGGTWASNFESVPASLRYFAGGDQSLRGYLYEELGPTADNGEVIGGRNLVLGSVELERTIWGRWGAALFVDAGNAFDGVEVDPKQSAGVGVRWNSPVGPLRLDIAYPIADPSKGYRFHFTMGPDL